MRWSAGGIERYEARRASPAHSLGSPPAGKRRKPKPPKVEANETQVHLAICGRAAGRASIGTIPQPVSFATRAPPASCSAWACGQACRTSCC